MPIAAESGTTTSPAPVPKLRWVALGCFCAAAVLLIPVEAYGAGAVLWLLSLAAALRDESPAVRRRFAVLLGCIAILAAAPIHTDLSLRHFVTLGIPFAAVIVLPAAILGRTDPGTIQFRLWPHRFRWLDVGYAVISVPLAYLVIRWYFFDVNPFMPRQWPLPADPGGGAIARLFWGINGVGIWDELFFVNTVYAVLRSMFSFRVANLAQAVVYTAVLNDMAFVGIGPVLVYLFALTQGLMFEESESLLYVLIVHLVVDYFLVSLIVQGHYPGLAVGWLFH
jgi:hypothetical protein